MSTNRKRTRSRNSGESICREKLISTEMGKRARNACAICAVIFLSVVAVGLFVGNDGSSYVYAASGHKRYATEDPYVQDGLQSGSKNTEGEESLSEGFYVSRLKEGIYDLTKNISQESEKDFDEVDALSIMKSWGFRASVDEEDVKTIPRWAKTEIPDIGSYAGWVSNSDFTLIGIFAESDKDETFNSFIAECRQLGWSFDEETNESDVISMVKQKGECKWMMATFMQGEETTNIVLHIQHV